MNDKVNQSDLLAAGAQDDVSIQLPATLQKIKRHELATLMTHLTRAPFELFCLLYSLISSESSQSQEEHNSCMVCVNNAAYNYRTASGTYDISIQQRICLSKWSHQITKDTKFLVILAAIDEKEISKQNLTMATSIIKRGGNNTNKRQISFASRIQNSLTPSHVSLYAWCVDIVNRRMKQPLCINEKDHDSSASVSCWYTKDNQDDARERRKRRSSLAFNFLPTIPQAEPYVQTVTDTTMRGGRAMTVAMIKDMYKQHCAGKDVEVALLNFQGNEVVLLRKMIEKYGRSA